MSRANTRDLCLSALAPAALIVTGWTLYANAGQASKRPYIPRPGEIRPLQRSAGAAPAQPGGQSAPVPAPPKPDDAASKQGQLTGEDLTGFDKTGTLNCRDFVYTEDDMKVTGARASYNKKSKILDAEGNLVMDDTKHHMTGDKARYDNHANVKLAVLTGSVVIVMKPKDRSASDNGSDVDKEKSTGGTAYCDRLDYYKLKDFAVLSGHLVFKQKVSKDDGSAGERTLTAEHAEYDGKVDKMHLFAPVDVTDSDNQKFHFDHDVLVGTKSGGETVESKGHFTAVINVNDDADGKPSPKQGDSRPPDAGKEPANGKQGPAPAGTGSRQDPPVKKNP